MQADCRLRWLMVGDGFCLQSMTSSHNARFGTEKDQAKKELGVRTTCAARRANLAKRVECGQLAGAFGPPTALQSGSKLHALHALRDIRLRLCRLCEISGYVAAGIDPRWRSQRVSGRWRAPLARANKDPLPIISEGV